MKIEWYIKKWFDSWLISQDQAKTMIAEAKEIQESEKKNRVAWMFWTVWAVVLWIWLLLFIGANWQEIPTLLKILVSLWLCGWSAYGSYYYEQLWDRPRTSGTLAFLSSIFWWATVILVSQQYSTWDTSKIHYMILIWLAGTIPAIYAFNSAATAWLFSALVIAWVFSFVMSWDWDSWAFALAASWILLYWIWWLHSLIPNYRRIWRVYSVIWLYVTMFVFLSLSVFGYYDLSYALREWSAKYIFVFAFDAAIILAAAYASRDNLNKMLVEYVPPVVWLLLCTWIITSDSFAGVGNGYSYREAVSFFPVMIAMNAYIVVICSLVLWIGYQNRDSKLVNAGYFFWTIYLIVKYCQIWWGMMSASFFFIAGGILFLILGYFIEKKRKETISNFKAIWANEML
jgi:uncharacterized membrane protein